MSKRAELHKEYYKQFGMRMQDGKVKDHYVKWLEDLIIQVDKSPSRDVVLPVSSDVHEQINASMVGFRSCPRCKGSDLFDLDDVIMQCGSCGIRFKNTVRYFV